MQIKMVEDELTHNELTYPMTPQFHLSLCFALVLTPSIKLSLIAPVRADGSSQSFGQKEHSAFLGGRFWHISKRQKESTWQGGCKAPQPNYLALFRP